MVTTDVMNLNACMHAVMIMHDYLPFVQQQNHCSVLAVVTEVHQYGEIDFLAAPVQAQYADH